ncbi:MAG: transglycosylase SLT domain-containing protein [Alistipes sp.]|nr:transglycosylase SLT domain-containing protein [Alistipes sp.]MBR2006443.1 transglycosylase SLT domain-containing protein [Alistipes sp.]MBR2629156.1 transglycosylase SLT domain-containing protein [Alistipes sp.]
MSKKTLIFSIVLIVLITFMGAQFLSDDMWQNSATSQVPDAESELAAEMASDTTDVVDEWIISVYDDMMQRIGEEEGQDWRLMSAIAYNESRFMAHVVSKRGAVGLMQVTPIVGRQFNVDKEHLSDPETNIRLATKLLRKIDATLKMSSSTPENDRMSIILACYNGGIGHVSDARRLAKSNGENPNSWEVVARYLQQKADPAVYESELVKYGKFTGSRQTEAYVREVMKRYDVYCKMTSQQ